MRKHQQFTYTLSPFSDIQSTTNSNNIIKKFYYVHIFWHPQFGVKKFIVEQPTNGLIWW
jgi:hypothetical protein